MKLFYGLTILAGLILAGCGGGGDPVSVPREA